MKHRSVLRGAFSALVAGLILGLSTVAQAAVTQNEMFDEVVVLELPCGDAAGHIVEFQTRLHLLATTTVNPNGGFSVTAISTMHGTGVDLADGTDYNLISKETVVSGGSSDGSPAVLSQVISTHCVSRGPEPDGIIHFVVHFTFNANGEITAFVDNGNPEVECRG